MDTILFKENQKIIDDLEEKIKSLGIFEIENYIKEDKGFNDVFTEKIFKARKDIRCILRRIMSINEKVVMREEILNSKLIGIGNMIAIPVGIQFMDMEINHQIYLVQKFYQEIHEKYCKNISKYIELGMADLRCLKVEYLEENEKKKAHVMDEYLKLCWIREQMEVMIDLLKCIQFNYLECGNDESVGNTDSYKTL